LPEDKMDLASPIPWRRSLRASQERRAAAARRRRRRLRGRRGTVLALALTASLAGTALAAGTGGTSTTTVRSGARGAAVSAIQVALGLPADGVYGPRTRHAVRLFQRAHGLQVDGIVGPQTLAALGLAPASTSSADVPAVAGSASAPTPTLARIASCESGGDPTAVSPNGRYRGKYQFSRATWRWLGGTGDPAQAPESVQDEMAAKLLAQRGTEPWPVCSRS
jgi:hypothetical protein